MALLILASCCIHCGNEKVSIPRPDPDQAVATYGDRTVTVRDVLIAFQESNDFSLAHGAIAQKRFDTYILDIAFEIAYDRYHAEKAKENRLHLSEEFQTTYRDYVNTELYQKVLMEDILKKIEIPENEIRRYYQDHKQTLFLDPKTNKYVVQGIYALKANHPPEAARQRIEEAKAKLDAGEDFRAVAVQYSDAPLEQRGSENTIPPGYAHQDIEEQWATLKDGEVSDIIELDKGYYIFKKIKFIEPAYQPYEEVRHTIIDMRTQELLESGIYLLTQELYRKHGLLVNSDWLDEDDTDETNPNLIVISVPGVYELTTAQFEQLAVENQKFTRDEKKQYLQFLANKAICLAEALDRGWTEDDVNIPVQYWATHYLAQLYRDLTVREQIDKKYFYSDEQTKAFYEKNRHQPYFQTPMLYNLTHLLVQTPLPKSSDQFQSMLLFKKAESIANQIFLTVAEGQAFDEVAILFSRADDLTIQKTDFGFIPISRLSPFDQEAILHPEGKSGPLQAGEIGFPRRVFNISKKRYGYDIFYLRDLVPSRQMTYDEAKVVIAKRVADEGSQAIRNAMKEEFISSHPETVNHSSIEAIKTYIQFLIDRTDLKGDLTRYEEPGKQV